MKFRDHEVPKLWSSEIIKFWNPEFPKSWKPEIWFANHVSEKSGQSEMYIPTISSGSRTISWCETPELLKPSKPSKVYETQDAYASSDSSQVHKYI